MFSFIRCSLAPKLLKIIIIQARSTLFSTLFDLVERARGPCYDSDKWVMVEEATLSMLAVRKGRAFLGKHSTNT